MSWHSPSLTLCDGISAHHAYKSPLRHAGRVSFSFFLSYHFSSKTQDPRLHTIKFSPAFVRLHCIPLTQTSHLIMATTAYSRHPVSYASHQKTLPFTMPTGKAPVYTQPISRVAEPAEYSDTSSSYTSSRGRSAGSYSVGSRSIYESSQSGGDYVSNCAPGGIDVVDELSERMNSAFDPIRMDRSLAKQTQTCVLFPSLRPKSELTTLIVRAS
jgi:hypothetical protein